MSTFVMSLHRLYNKGNISKEKIDDLLNRGKITQEEYEFIISE